MHLTYKNHRGKSQRKRLDDRAWAGTLKIVKRENEETYLTMRSRASLRTYMMSFFLLLRESRIAARFAIHEFDIARFYEVVCFSLV